MSATLLLDLPSADTWTIDSFLVTSQVVGLPKLSSCILFTMVLYIYVYEQATCQTGVEVLHTSSGKVEEAVKELLHMIRSAALLPTPSPTDSEDIAKSKTGTTSLYQHHCPEHMSAFVFQKSWSNLRVNVKTCFHTSNIATSMLWCVLCAPLLIC